MEILFAFIAELGEKSLWLMWPVVLFLFYSGVRLLFRGYWIFKNKIRIAGAISWSFLAVLLIFSFLLFDVNVAHLENNPHIAAALEREFNKNAHWFTLYATVIVPVFAYIGYRTAYFTYLWTMLFWGALAGYLLFSLVGSNPFSFQLADYKSVSFLSVIGATVGAYLAFKSIRTFIILTSAFMGAGLLAHLSVFILAGQITSFEEISRAINYVYSLSFLADKSMFELLWDGDYKLFKIDEGAVLMAVYYSYLSYSLMAFLMFIGVHVQFSGVIRIYEEEVQGLRKKVKSDPSENKFSKLDVYLSSDEDLKEVLFAPIYSVFRYLEQHFPKFTRYVYLLQSKSLLLWDTLLLNVNKVIAHMFEKIRQLLAKKTQ